MHPSGAAAPSTSQNVWPWYHWRRWGWNFLTLSILGHVLFGVLAAYLIVATFTAKKKPDFKAPGPAGPNASTRSLEHKVSMAKQRQHGGAPPNAKRVTTTGLTKVALPVVPSMPKMDAAAVPLTMAGMSGTGAGLGGFGSGSGGGGGGGGGGGLNVFGLRTASQGLVGTFYDLKQSPQGQPTNITQDEYATALKNFVAGGMNPGVMTRYFKGPNPLYITQLLIPVINADEGPRAFDLANKVQPGHWCVHYKGRVLAPASGRFRFVGVGDDVLVVRFNNQVVLDCGFLSPTGRVPGRYFWYDEFAPEPRGGWFKGCGEGNEFTVTAGQSYPIDIVIGEAPGGKFHASLLLEESGHEYRKDGAGNPILPIFHVTRTRTTRPEGQTPPVAEEESAPWLSVNAVTSPSASGR